MPQLARIAAALCAILTLGACSDASEEAPDPDAASASAEKEPATTEPPASEPTALHIAHVVELAPAAGGCLDSVRSNWQPDSKAKTQRVCGVQEDAEVWFSVDPASAFEATVTDASANQPDNAPDSWVVEITLDDQSAQRFAQMTSKLLAMSEPEPMALIVRGEVVSAPVPTAGLENVSSLQVAGNFTQNEAEEIASSLGAQ